MPVSEDPSVVPAENPKTPEKKSGPGSILIPLGLLILIVGCLLAASTYQDNKKEAEAKKQLEAWEKETKEAQEYWNTRDEENRKLQEEWEKEQRERREKAQKEYEEGCALLAKMMSDLNADQLQTEGLEATFIGEFCQYGEEVPEEVLAIAEKLQNDTPFGVWLVLGRPRLNPKNLRDFISRRCVMIGVMLERDGVWNKHIFAVWDSKDLKRFAIGNEQMKKFLAELQPQTAPPEEPK